MKEEKSMSVVETYTFKYGSDSDSIDLNTMLLSQIHFGTILSEIKNEVAPDSDMKIKIRPLERGSVPFDIVINLSWLESLFSRDNVAYGSAIISALVGIVQLRMWLKSSKPENVINVDAENVTVIKDNTRITVNKTVYNIYHTNVTIDTALSKTFEAIEKDEEVTKIEILDAQKKPLVTVPREEFSGMSKPSEIFEQQTRTATSKRQMLTIFKVVFDKGYKWQFYMEGRKISASIEDTAFMERVNRGERFAKGDKLEVDMEVVKVYEPTLDMYVEKDFKIISVLNHTARPENTDLFRQDPQ